MKFIDLLKVTSKDSYVKVKVNVYGMQFETCHSAEYYFQCGGELLDKTIEKIYAGEHEILVKLDNK